MQKFTQPVGAVAFVSENRALTAGSPLASNGGMGNRDAAADSGFSLIETLIAASILATALAALTQVLVITSAATDNAGRMTKATLLAAQKIEDLRASSATVLEGGGADVPAPGFAREWLFGVLPSDPDHVVVIEAVVSTKNGAARLVALRTIVP